MFAKSKKLDISYHPLNFGSFYHGEKQDKNFKLYYLIIDNDHQEAYFCFSGAVRTGWEDLITDYQNIKEAEIEFETNERGNHKVVNLYAIRESDIIA